MRCFVTSMALQGATTVLFLLGMAAQVIAEKPSQTSPLWVRDADNPAFQPFAFSFECVATCDRSFTVPADKRLVIEGLAASETIIGDPSIGTFLPAAGYVRLRESSSTERRQEHWLPLVGSSYAENSYRAQAYNGFGGAVKLYVEPGAEVEIDYGQRATVGSGPHDSLYTDVSLSGYFVDVPVAATSAASVPEPSSLLLFGCGALALVRRKVARHGRRDPA